MKYILALSIAALPLIACVTYNPNTQVYTVDQYGEPVKPKQPSVPSPSPSTKKPKNPNSKFQVVTK